MNKRVKIFLSAFMALAVSMGSTVCYAAGKDVSTTLSGNNISGGLSVGDTNASAYLSCTIPAELSVNGYIIVANRYNVDAQNYKRLISASEGTTCYVTSSASVDNSSFERIVSAYCTFSAWYGTESWSDHASY